jgi:hypothetical protein
MGEGLIECKNSKQKLGLIGLQFRSSFNQALVFSLIVDKSVFDARRLGGITNLATLDYQTWQSDGGHFGELVGFLQTNLHLEELVLEIAEGCFGYSTETMDVILKMPNLRTMLLHLSHVDDFPWKLKDLEKSCPLIQVYGQRINILAEMVSY